MWTPSSISYQRCLWSHGFLAMHCAVTSPYQPVIFRWHLILNTKKSRILTGTVLAGARKLSISAQLCSQCRYSCFSVRADAPVTKKMRTSSKGQSQCLFHDVFHLACVRGWGSVYHRKMLPYCLSSLQLNNPIIPQSSRPSAGMHYIITDKENEYGYLSTQLHCRVITYGESSTNLRNWSAAIHFCRVMRMENWLLGFYQKRHQF